jgi:hypothetical protein
LCLVTGNRKNSASKQRGDINNFQRQELPSWPLKPENQQRRPFSEQNDLGRNQRLRTISDESELFTNRRQSSTINRYE